MTVTSPVANGPVCTAYTTYTQAANGLSGNFFSTNSIIFLDGTNIYACLAGGLNISNNGGTSFSTKTTTHGLARNDVNGVYAAGSIVFAATGAGLSQSTDGGASFTTNASLGTVATYCIAVSGTNVYVGTQNGVAISTNGGATFTTTNIGPITSIAVSGTTVVAGSSGIFISTNSGSSFTQKTRADGLATNRVTSVAVVGGTIYVAMINDNNSSPALTGGVAITTDNGATFTNKRTADGLGSSQVNGIQVIGTTVYAATNGGLSISTNSGGSFTNYTTSNTTGFGGNFVGSMYVTNSKIYAGTSNGLSACSPVTPSVSIAASPTGSITAGTGVTFTATPTNGGTTPAYQWKKNGSNVGTNSATYTDAALANNDKITCVLTSNDACASPTTATSNELTMTVTTPCVNPTAYNVTGGGAYCASGTGVEVGLANSESGVMYQLKKDNVDDGTAVAGTGSVILLGTKTAAGTYTVVATRTVGACTNSMTGSVTVSITALPTAHNVTGGGSYCAGGTGVEVGLSNSETGVTYQLKKDNVDDGAAVAGTGAAITFGTKTAAGNYTVVATRTVGACTANMNGSATVTITPLPVAYNVTGGGAYCAGGTGVAVGLSNSETGVSYQLKKDGSPVGNPVPGTGSAISFGNQTAAGVYTVVATTATGGCNANMTGTALIRTLNMPTAFNLSGGGTTNAIKLIYN